MEASPAETARGTQSWRELPRRGPAGFTGLDCGQLQQDWGLGLRDRKAQP